MRRQVEEVTSSPSSSNDASQHLFGYICFVLEQTLLSLQEIEFSSPSVLKLPIGPNGLKA